MGGAAWHGTAIVWGIAMLRRFYDRVLALSADRRAPVWLALISFAESSFFPVPPDALLIPMALARPERAYRFALICTVASVIGGALGYLIGYALYDQVAGPLIRFYHYEDAAQAFVDKFNQYGLWVILIKGLTPIPYKIVTITSGLAHFNFGVFMAASVLTRGARFFLVAALLRQFGEPVREFIERRLTLVTSLTAAGIVGGVLLLKFV
jgi:membrane protein YqaA with SNARE-associated domain